jgi:hypothetical protein
MTALGFVAMPIFAHAAHATSPLARDQGRGGVTSSWCRSLMPRVDTAKPPPGKPRGSQWSVGVLNLPQLAPLFSNEHRPRPTPEVVFVFGPAS